MNLTNCLFLGGTCIAITALITLIPLMRRFEKEGKKIGFDLYAARSALALLQPDALPATLQPLGRKIRTRVFFFLWPAFALFFTAWMLRA